MACFALSDYLSCAQSAKNRTVSYSPHTHCKNRRGISRFKLAHSSPSHRVKCSEGHPTPIGEAGRVKTLQAQPKRLTARPMESGRPQRNGTVSSPLHTHKKQDGVSMFEPAFSHSSAQSEVQRRPPDSYGRSGQGETLQAAPKRLTARPMESGRPQRNGTVSSPLHTHKKQDGVSMFRISTLPLLSTE